MLLPISLGQLDISALRGLITAAKQNDDGLPLPSEIDAVALALEYPQLEHPFTKRFPIARESEFQAVKLNEYPRLRAPVPELRHPAVEGSYPVRAAVFADLGHTIM